MDLHSLKNEGWTNTEIAEELGYHPATVAKWLKAGDPPERVAAADGGVLYGWAHPAQPVQPGGALGLAGAVRASRVVVERDAHQDDSRKDGANAIGRPGTLSPCMLPV